MAAHGGGDILQSAAGDDVHISRRDHDPKWSNINLRTHVHKTIWQALHFVC